MSRSETHLPDTLLEVLAEALGSGEQAVPASDAPGEFPGVSPSAYQEFEQAAAAIACVTASADTDSMPSELRLRCSGAARAVLTDPNPEPSSSPAPLKFTPERNHEPSRSGGLGLAWLAAAACLLLAVTAWWPARAPLDAVQRMQNLTATASDLDRWDWDAWDPALEGVSGEVVWSEQAQEGYLVLAGLPQNDPTQEQYQLWVIESSRGTPLEVPPVDGGVFDITEDGEVVVQIRCAIPAQGVVAFAVTREPPGGVVVSDQSQKVVIAQAPSEG